MLCCRSTCTGLGLPFPHGLQGLLGLARMDTAFSDDPIFPVLPAVTGHGEEAARTDEPTFAVAARLDLDAAQRIAWRELFARFLAPADIRMATVLDRMRLLQVPFWRVDVGVDGFHVAFSGLPLGTSGVDDPDPRPGVATRVTRLDGVRPLVLPL